MDANNEKQLTVAVLVLGDVGRSPRMQYHALSLANSDRVKRVFLVGYRGERCVPDVEAAGAITPILLAPELLPRPKARALYLLYAPIKAVLQLLQLLWALLVTLPRCDVLLLQTPPAIPTLAAACAYRAACGVPVVVDWHNLGFSMLEHTLRAGHPFVKLARAYERALANTFDGHLCVTRAMAAWLQREWGVAARVLHDRPPAFFRRLAPPERHALLRRLAPQFVDASGAPLWPAEGEEGSPWRQGATPWTEVGANGAARARASAPALLVSSTSWTADEDFGVFLDALGQLDAALQGGAAQGAAASPRPAVEVVAVITGKGPQKAMYEAQMRSRPWRRVRVCTMWLEPADYPALLGAADLGVCLHTSTSGLDLPMKVLDMFGAGLPVCAVGFSCLGELLTHGTNGLVFDSAATLAEQLHSLVGRPAEGPAAGRGELAALRVGLTESEARRPRWAENWAEAAAPLLLGEGVRARRGAGWRALVAIAAVVAALTLLLGSWTRVSLW